jgi:hypothetical protein
LLPWLMLAVVVMWCMKTLVLWHLSQPPSLLSSAHAFPCAYSAARRRRASYATIASADSAVGGNDDSVANARIAAQRICITTLSDAGAGKSYASASAFARKAPRDFTGVADAAFATKEVYAARHGYTLLRPRHLLDASLPANWSKIAAVQDALRACEWVVWMDADTLVMNDSIRLETLLPAHTGSDGNSDGSRGGDGNDDEGAALLITRDVTGFNSGVWAARNCKWTRALLTRWRSLAPQFVTPPGSTKSGDNDALKHLLAQLPPAEMKTRVRVPPQCLLNSYVWQRASTTSTWVALKQWLRWHRHADVMQEGAYLRGDFVAHLAGVDDKSAAAASLLPSTHFTSKT